MLGFVPLLRNPNANNPTYYFSSLCVLCGMANATLR